MTEHIKQKSNEKKFINKKTERDEEIKEDDISSINKNGTGENTNIENDEKSNKSSNKKNKVENNSNKKKLNTNEPIKTESKLKSNNFKNNIPLKEFLSQINLLKYFDNLDSNGFDDVNILIEEAKKGETIKDEELKEVGISCPGDRAKILIRIKEKANIFGFSVPKNVYHICQNLNNMIQLLLQYPILYVNQNPFELNILDQIFL